MGATVGDATMVDDSTTTDPSEVTDVDCTVVVVETAGLEFSEVTDAADDDDDSEVVPPVLRLTACLFSSLANASSICLAGTVEAEMRANRRKFGRYMIEKPRRLIK